MEYGNVQQRINDMVGDNIKKLAQLFPSAVKDGEVDFETLKEELGQFIEVGSEKYELTWAGKKNAKKIAQEDIIGKTLKFIPEGSRDADTTENLYIEGDNLEVLKLLRQNYYSAIKMIYIDPPYNTGNDFVYKDDYSMTEKENEIAEGNADELGGRYVINSRNQSRYHANWLNMMYPRLKIAKDLLSDEGAIFISIDGNEVDNLKQICDEIFGVDNFRNQIIVKRRTKSLNLQFADNGLNSFNIGYEYILVYSKSQDFLFEPIRVKKINTPGKGTWNVFWSNADRPTMRYDILGFTPDTGQWRWQKELAEEAVDNYGTYLKEYASKMSLEEYWKSTGKKMRFIRRIPDGLGKNGGVQYWVAPSDTSLRTSNWADLEVSQIAKDYDLPFDNPKNVSLIKTLISAVKGKDFTILDFFSGSGTTADAVYRINNEDGGKRKYILIQIPEACNEKSEAYKKGYSTVCQLGEERIKLAGNRLQEMESSLKIDLGYKLFRLDKSNIKWNSLTNIGQLDLAQMETTPDLIDFMPGAKDVDIVYELMLRQKDVPLSSRIEHIFGGGGIAVPTFMRIVIWFVWKQRLQRN
jgi:Adenine specific DNA methylase Mod